MDSSEEYGSGGMPYNIFVIYASGAVEHSMQNEAPKLAQLQKAVGGYIETVPYFTNFTHGGVKYQRGKAFANEEGLLKGLPFNNTATNAWRNCPQFRRFHFNAMSATLVGDVIFYSKGRS